MDNVILGGTMVPDPGCSVVSESSMADLEGVSMRRLLGLFVVRVTAMMISGGRLYVGTRIVFE